MYAALSGGGFHATSPTTSRTKWISGRSPSHLLGRRWSRGVSSGCSSSGGVEVKSHQRLRSARRIHAGPPAVWARTDPRVPSPSERSCARVHACASLSRRVFQRVWHRLTLGDEVSRTEVDQLEEKQGTYITAILAKMPGIDFAYEPLRVYPSNHPESDAQKAQQHGVAAFIVWAAHEENCPFIGVLVLILSPLLHPARLREGSVSCGWLIAPLQVQPVSRPRSRRGLEPGGSRAAVDRLRHLPRRPGSARLRKAPGLADWTLLCVCHHTAGRPRAVGGEDELGGLITPATSSVLHRPWASRSMARTDLSPHP